MDTGLVYRRGVPVYSSAFAVTHCAYPRRDGQAELTRVTYRDGLPVRRRSPIQVPSNRAWRRVTSLVETNALPLSQTATLSLYHNCDSTTIRLRHDYDKKLTF